MRFYLYILLLLSYAIPAQILIPTPETAFELQHNFNSKLIRKKNIRKITFDIVDKKDFEVPVDKNLSETYEFDTNGKLTRFYYTSILKIIEKQVTITAPHRGRKKGFYTYTDVKSDYIYDTISTSYYYDNDGKLILKRYHDGALYYESRYYRYDKQGNIAKEMRYRETNNSKDKSVFILGGQLLLSEDSFQCSRFTAAQLQCVLLNNENRPYKQQTINFDSLGRKKKITEHYTAAAWIQQQSEFEYKGDQLSLAKFSGNADKDIRIKNTYEYDGNNELLTEKQYKNDVLLKEISYVTDSANTILNSLVIRDHVNKSMRIVKLRYDFGSVSKGK